MVFDHGDNGHVTDSTGAQLSAADRKGVRETFLDVQDLSEAIRAVEQSESLGGDPGENTSCGLLVNINEEAAGGVLLGPGQETVFQTVGADFCRNSSSVAESSVSTELVKPRRFETFEVEQVELMLGMWSAVFFQEQNEDNTKHVKLSRRMTLGPADDPGAKIYPSCGDWCKGGYVLDDDHSEDGSFPHPAADADVKICIKEKKQWSTQSLACWNEAAGKKKLTNFSSREDAREQVFDVLLDEDVVFTKTIKLGPVTREKRLVGNHLLFLVAEDKQTCVVFFRSGEVKDPETTIEPHLGNSEVWAKLLALLSDLPAEATVIFGGHSEGSGWAHVAAHLYEKSLNHPVQGRGTGPLHVKVTTTAMLGFSKNYKRKIMGGEFSALNIVMGIQPRGNPEKVFWDMFTLHPNQQDETTQNNTEWINPKGRKPRRTYTEWINPKGRTKPRKR